MSMIFENEVSNRSKNVEGGVNGWRVLYGENVIIEFYYCYIDC